MHRLSYSGDWAEDNSSMIDNIRARSFLEVEKTKNTTEYQTLSAKAMNAYYNERLNHSGIA